MDQQFILNNKLPLVTNSIDKILNLSRLFLSNNDMETYYHLINLNWHEKYSIYLSINSYPKNLSKSRINQLRYFRFENHQKLNLFSDSFEIHHSFARLNQNLFQLKRTIHESFHKTNPKNSQLIRVHNLLRNLSMSSTDSLALKSHHHTNPSRDGGLNIEKKKILEIENTNFKKKTEIKTREENLIYSTKKPSSPHQVQIHQPNQSSISNNRLESIRVSVSSSPYENEFIQKIQTISPTKSSIEENIEQPIYHRPLLALLNQEKALKESSTNILPPKSFLPFQPKVLHKQFQEPINNFECSTSSPTNVRRNGITRSHTIPKPTDLINTDFKGISSNDSLTCQSTPHLIPSDQSNLTIEHNSTLSTSIPSLNSTSISNGTPPTSNVTIDDKNEAKRKAIALQMYDTEKSYVEALKNLVTKYYLPMKDKNIVSNDLINDIFYKIPEIHIHHTAFLISLSQKLTQWDNKQTVVDLLLQMFTRMSVIETYTSFVNNYKTSQMAIGTCREMSSFNKFLEQQARDHRGKLTLHDLLIQPVQRIPRYELYLKDFLKCTNINHPDYQLMLKAQLEIHSLAEQIDQVQKEVGSTELNLNKNALETLQDLIENLKDLVNDERYYISYDIVTIQSASGFKKDRGIFLFNDLMIITSSKRRNVSSTKKSTNSFIVNSPSGKQYIENNKHKLIMKISIENIELASYHLKKSRSSISTPPSLKKSHSLTSTLTDNKRHFEEDLITLGQISDLSRTITVSHQQLDDSIKETVEIVNKHLLDETTSLRKASPEPSNISEEKSTNIQLILTTNDSTETINVIFSTIEQKTLWENNFLDAKKILFENLTGRRNLTFEHALTLPHHRPGSQYTCGIIRPYLNEICLCNTEGEICLINYESDLTVKSLNSIATSKINCICYVPFNDMGDKSLLLKTNLNSNESLDFDSSDDEQESLHQSTIQHDYSNDMIWIGTIHGELFIYDCSQTMKDFGRKNRIIKQFHSSIHSILYFEDKVFLALNHGQLAVFKRDINQQWDLDNPIIESIDENNEISNQTLNEYSDEDSNDPISVMTIAAGKLWCALRDRIFILCTNSLQIQHSFIVDDCHRHIHCMVTGGSLMHHVWITSQGSHEIRLYHATNLNCLFETSIRTIVAQKLQICDDIIRAHKLGCLHISTLNICKETLWIGTSAGILLNLTIPQLVDNLSIHGTNKFNLNSIQLKSLSYGHVGPVRFCLSMDKFNFRNENFKRFLMTIGDGFDDYQNLDENLGKDDALAHLILWQF
ncbi:unnamed protein product [Adineta ricciae]|uniref:DH domain-containing protein n=1 Tax=Adineta ricciae TaxID=249248 RepID=A0A814ZHU1_ADIRI|nr:unnamed protein product [Adineta ricciae]